MQTIAPQDVCYRLVATKEGQRPSRRRIKLIDCQLSSLICFA